MSTITIDLTPEAEAFFLKVTGLKKPDAAVAKYLRNAYAESEGKADEAPAKKLNAATLKVIRSKSTRGEKVFADGMDGVAYLRKRFG